MYDDNISGEDLRLINGLLDEKDRIVEERDIVRAKIKSLRQLEIKMSKEIQGLSLQKIAEKFELPNSRIRSIKRAKYREESRV